MVRAIIQARMGSSRLRGKSLLPILGVPLLTRVINTVKGLKGIDEIYVATTGLSEDDVIVQLAQTQEVKVFRGSALDLLERFYFACADLKESDTMSFKRRI